MNGPDERPPADDDLGAPPRVDGWTIRGVVTDFDGMPLVGVRVEAAATGGADLDLLPVLTDAEGGFLLEGLGEGRYDIRFVLGRVKARTLAVPVGTDQLHVQLARPQGILLVVKTDNGRPPPDLLTVVLEREARLRKVREHVGRHLKTRMLLWSIRPGTYTVTVWGGGFLPVQAHGIEVREDEPAPEVQMLLSAPGGTIRGAVRDADGGVPADALVAWRTVTDPQPWPRHTCSLYPDAEGDFLVRGLPAGRYLLSVGRENGAIVDREIAIEAEETVDVAIRLP